MANLPTPELLRGTLDLLVLRTLRHGPLHGYGIAQHIGRVSEDVLKVGEGSLYPALQRLLVKGRVQAEWRSTETNRKARVYTLTPAGRRQLGEEERSFAHMVAAIQRVLDAV